MATPVPHAPQVRSLYRRILRELPLRQLPQTVLSNPSPLQKHIRENLSLDPPVTEDKPIGLHLDEMEQFVQYAKAQRLYTTLLERYVLLNRHWSCWVWGKGNLG